MQQIDGQNVHNMWSQYVCINYGLLWPLFHMIMHQLLFIFVLSLLDSCSSFLCYHKVLTSVCSVGEMFTHFIFFGVEAQRVCRVV